MNNIENQETKLFVMLDYLRQYYTNKPTTIIGLNDSQGVDTGLLFRKGILELVRDMIISSKNNIDIFNAFSLMFNKTEHVDYFLDCNITLEDVKRLQIEGAVSALSKFFHTDLRIPKMLGDLGKIGYISKVLYKSSKKDSKFALTNTIINSSSPVIIYSSGANDLMREGYCSPFSIDKAYKNRYQDRTYFYALDKFQNPNTIRDVVLRVEHNFNHILSLNSRADIFALGLYLPASMQKEGMDVFNEVITEYNFQLEQLCDKYHIDYINTYTDGTSLSKSTKNFHASHNIHKLLANQVVEKLYQKKIKNSDDDYNFSKTSLEVNSDINQLQHKLLNDCLSIQKLKLKKMQLFEKYTKNNEKYSSDEFLNLSREIEICTGRINELDRQIAVVAKVKTKSKCE